MVPKKRHSKSKVGRRRAHLALEKKNLLVCGKCSGPRLPHRACSQCGNYKDSNLEKAKALK